MKTIFSGQPPGSPLATPYSSLNIANLSYLQKRTKINSLVFSDFLSGKCFFRPGSIRIKYGLGLVFLFCLSHTLYGQSLGRQLIGAAGGSSRQGDLQITWSLGEVSVAHLKTNTDGGSLTEGFQQPSIMPIHEGEGFSKVKVAPNPVRNILSLYIPGEEKAEWMVILNDVNGKTLLRKAGLPSGDSEIDLGKLASGVYFLSVYQVSTGAIVQTIKVLKL